MKKFILISLSFLTFSSYAENGLITTTPSLNGCDYSMRNFSEVERAIVNNKMRFADFFLQKDVKTSVENYLNDKNGTNIIQFVKFYNEVNANCEKILQQIN